MRIFLRKNLCNYSSRHDLLIFRTHSYYCILVDNLKDTRPMR
jgi:hypothetical protein